MKRGVFIHLFNNNNNKKRTNKHTSDMIQINVIHNNMNKQINYFQLFIEFGSIDTQILVLLSF